MSVSGESVGTPSQEGSPEEAWVEGDLALVTWRHGNDPDPFITTVGIRTSVAGWKVPKFPAVEGSWQLTYASDKDCRSAVRLAAVVVSSPATPNGQKEGDGWCGWREPHEGHMEGGGPCAGVEPAPASLPGEGERR